MDAAQTTPSRLANVSIALIVASRGEGDDETITNHVRALARLFEDVLVLGVDLDLPEIRRVARQSGPTGLGDLIAALDAAREDRVLVVDHALDAVTPALLLGLIAWPEQPCVIPRIANRLEPLCAVYRRSDALVAACEAQARGIDLHAFVAQLECGVLEGADLDPLLEASTALS